MEGRRSQRPWFVRGFGAVVAVWSAFALASSSAALALPLGDGKVQTKRIKSGQHQSCRSARPKAGSAPRPWIDGRRWNLEGRPVVDGAVRWPQASFSLTAGKRFSIRSNGLPLNGRTGVFPVSSAAPAAPYLGGGEISEQAISASLPAPRKGVPRGSFCVSPRSPLGVALNGVPLLPPVDRAGRDLVAREPTDACGGTTGLGDVYGYRAGAPCLDSGPADEHSPPVGYTRAGIWLFGSRGPGGRTVGNRDLDACHGHTHQVSLFGRVARFYHYHQTAAFPYTVGCFRRKPTRLLIGPVARKGLGITADPGLYPSFDPGVSDYVVRCAGPPVRVTVDAGSGYSVEVDGASPSSGRFQASVSLGEGQAFSFHVTNAGVRREYHVRCLPSDFPAWSFQKFATPLQPYYAVTPWFGSPSPDPYAILFDRNGVPIWWLRTGTLPLDFKVLSDGTMATARFSGGSFGSDPNLGYELHGLDGTLKRVVQTVGSPTDGHDLQEVGNGNLLVLTYRARDHVDLSPYGGPADATVVDGEIQELDPNGNLVWSWNSKDHIDLSETTSSWWSAIIPRPTTLPDGREAYDIVHINSVERVGSSLVTSLPGTDAVYEIDRATGAVQWKLGGTDTPDSLTVIGDTFGASLFGGQHDARVLPDGTVTVHDNGARRGRPPRAVRYSIDELARTATLLESVGDPDALIPGCCGGARRHAGGGWVVAWGQNPLVSEFAPGGTRTFKLSFPPPIWTYRADPVAEGRLSLPALRQGMSTMYPR
jgi:hypothetical protein